MSQSTLWNMMLGTEVVYRDAKGTRTRCIEAGSGPALFLLHGTGGHAEAWAKNFNELAKHFHVIAFDFVGHGLSDKRTDIDYLIPDYVQQVRDLMDAMGIEKAAFVGLSLGAWVASWLAIESPERVSCVVNATGAVFRWPEGQPANEAKDRDSWKKANDELATLNRDTVRKRLHTLFHNTDRCPEELVDLRLALYSQPGAPELIPALHQMIPYDSPGRVKFGLTPELLASISVPVLYLWGERNPGGSVKGAQRAAEITPNGELKVIADAGHWPQWEQPDAFNAIVTEYVEAHQ
jgi:pimeloyl-ACP methyl ester carboxylesterase